MKWISLHDLYQMIQFKLQTLKEENNQKDIQIQND